MTLGEDQCVPEVEYLWNSAFISQAIAFFSSNMFPNSVASKKKLCRLLCDKVEAGLQLGFDPDNYSEDLVSIYMHASLLISDDDGVLEQERKKYFQKRVFAVLDNGRRDGVWFYNMTCVHSQFKNMVEAEKHWEESCEKWRENQLEELFESALMDQDLRNVANQPWFEASLDKARERHKKWIEKSQGNKPDDEMEMDDEQ